MKIDFAGAIKKALDSTTADEQVVKAVEELRARTVMKVDGKPDVNTLTDLQVAAIAEQAIQATGMLGIITKAIIDEAVRAASAKEAVAAK